MDILLNKLNHIDSTATIRVEKCVIKEVKKGDLKIR